MRCFISFTLSLILWVVSINGDAQTFTKTSLDTTDATESRAGASVGPDVSDVDPLRYSCFRNRSYCCFGSDNSSWIVRSPRCAFDEASKSFPCSVKLGVNNWLNSFANVHVAKIFIEEFLGYPVEITADYAEFQNGDERTLVPLLSMWQWLHDGRIDAILEVWEIGKAEFMQEFFNVRQSVIHAGSLGVIGGIGWYIPSFLMQDASNDTHIHILGCQSREFLEYWRSFESDGAVDLFKNPLPEMPCCLSDTSDPRQRKPCMAAAAQGGTPVENGGIETTAECDAEPERMIPTYGGRFLEGSPTWKVWEDKIIRNLGLNFTIEYALTEQEILKQVELATNDNYGLLFYFWEPHAPFTRYNLTRINLPRRSQKCVDESRIEEYDCDYPQEILFKMYRAELARTKPDVAEFFEAFRFASNRDQEKILSDVYYQQRSFPNAACAWAKEKPEVWDKWLSGIEKKYSGKYWLAEPEPEVVDCKCSSNGTRVFYSRPKPPADDDDQVKMEIDDNVCDDPTFSTYQHRWKNDIMETVLLAEVKCEYAVENSAEAIAVYVVSSVMVLFLVVTMWLVQANRDKPHIKASNPVITLVFTAGALLMNMSPMLRIGEATTARCALSFSTFLYGFVWFEGSLIVKAYVLYVIFTPTARTTNRKRALLNYEHILFFLLSTVVVILWAVFVGFTPQPVKIVIPNTDLDYIGLQCPMNGSFGSVLLVLGLLMVITSCYWAFKTWSISPAFSEAKQMLVSCVNIIVFGGSTVIIVTSIQTLSQAELILIVSIAILVTTAISVSMTVWTRLYAVHAGWTFDRSKAIEESIRQRKQQGSSHGNGSVQVHGNDSSSGLLSGVGHAKGRSSMMGSFQEKQGYGLSGDEQETPSSRTAEQLTRSNESSLRTVSSTPIREGLDSVSAQIGEVFREPQSASSRSGSTGTSSNNNTESPAEMKGDPEQDGGNSLSIA